MPRRWVPERESTVPCTSKGQATSRPGNTTGPPFLTHRPRRTRSGQLRVQPCLLTCISRTCNAALCVQVSCLVSDCDPRCLQPSAHLPLSKGLPKTLRFQSVRLALPSSRPLHWGHGPPAIPPRPGRGGAPRNHCLSSVRAGGDTIKFQEDTTNALPSHRWAPTEVRQEEGGAQRRHHGGGTPPCRQPSP